MNINPIIKSDFPDLDIIRVDDTYYMISTTMYFMPGGVILRSFDLVNWEIYTYLYDLLEETDARKMKNQTNIYGQGMWAASLRHHQGRFYICFCCNDNQRTYIYHSESIKGPWKRQVLEGFYHDNSLIFDDDGRVFIVYGNTDLRLTQLKPDLSAVMPGGVDKVIFTDTANIGLGYEGAHIQKIKGRYYVSLIHWPVDGTKRRLQAVKMAENIEGPYRGGDVLDDDLGYFNNGVAQGALIDTPEDNWYAVLFQDRGAVGRIPVLVPVHWDDEYPVFGIDRKVPLNPVTISTRPDHVYEPFVFDDDFKYMPDSDGKIVLRKGWEWNHFPVDSCWDIDGANGRLTLKTDRVVTNVVQAPNTLTMRSLFPQSGASILIDGSDLNEGDYAGICALQGKYGMIAITREGDSWFALMQEKPGEADFRLGETDDRDPGVEQKRIPLKHPVVEFKMILDFNDMKDEARFYIKNEEQWMPLGPTKKLYFGLDHFTGCRIGLFCFSTIQPGGAAGFESFHYIRD